MTQKPTLLIVEDEESILQGLMDLFTFHGYQVEAKMDGQEGLDAALNGRFDGIILDVMLPSLDGFSICNAIRKQSREQPVIMLTAKNTEEDIINGLSLGADDYIAKPFSVRELVLRVDAVLRRSGKDRNQHELQIGANISIDIDNLCGLNQATSQDLLFTRREVDILSYLKLNKHRPISRSELLSEVWGYKKCSDIDTRTVDIHIAKLRKKIEYDAKNPQLLLTIRGEGYRINENVKT